jgi:hypothetical protein
MHLDLLTIITVHNVRYVPVYTDADGNERLPTMFCKLTADGGYRGCKRSR